MENILTIADAGDIQFLAILGTAAVIGAYALLSRGFATALFVIGLMSLGWSYLAGGSNGPHLSTFVAWYVANAVTTLAFVGMLRISSLIEGGRLRAFSSDLVRDQ